MAFHVSVFLENKIGRLERITAVLKEAGINILSMNLNHTPGGWGIVNLLVNQPEKAFRLLSEAGISAALRRIAVLPMGDTPGSLDGLLRKIALAGINFTTAYGRSGKENAWFVVDIEDFPDVRQNLLSSGLEILSDEVVYSLNS
jgi:hypothetical protein